MLHSLVQKTSETHVVSAYPTVIPTTFRDVFGQLVHQLLSDGKSAGDAYVSGKIMCNPLFPVKIFPPQSIHWSTGNSFHFKIWVDFFKVTRAIPGLPWTQDWVNVLRGVDQFIWKHLKTKDFSRRQELWVWSIWQRLTAFDCVWLRSTLLRDYSIGECDPTWHNM